MKKVLTIAGSDCSGGAGIQADIKTITAHGMYAMSVITALTAQNTTGVAGVQAIFPAFVAEQLDCVLSDIFPDSVKIGMVVNSGIIKAIRDKLTQYAVPDIVVDPVMVSSSGKRLLDDCALDALVTGLFPISTLVTPNIPEAEVLSGIVIQNREDMARAAAHIAQNTGGAVLIKGGHLDADAVDLLYDNGIMHWYTAERVANPNTHGTGCTLSSAIACNLAAGTSLADSVQNAKQYLTGAIQAMLDLGKGAGPLNHMYRLQSKG